jgi:hypothetical protein
MGKKAAVKVIASLAMLMSLVSCVHRPADDQYWFQGMGSDREIVVTVDTKHPEKLPGPLVFDDPTFAQLLQRVDRLSVALYDTADGEDPDGVLDAGDLSRYEFYGAAEGNIPAFLTNSMLLWNEEWRKIEEGTIRYYRNEWLGLDVFAPRRGLLLFASDDYLKAYRTIYKERSTRIPIGLADRMSNAVFGFYIAGPQAMIDVGLALPKTVLAQTASIVLVLEESGDGVPALGGIITMKSPKLANSLSILLKSSYISDKRRNREPLGDLTNLFILENDAVYINDMPLSDTQYSAFSEIFGSLASLTTGEKR